jgi:hypothetical protein
LCAEDVPAVACAGRFAPAETCATADFDPPCGAAACCLGNGNCVNLTATECGLGAGFWQPGEFCGLAGQACPLEACIGATGSCLQPHTTPACDDPLCCDEICQADDFCCLVEWDETCVSAALVVGLCTADIAPENDDFADALPLAAGMTPFNTVGASTDGPNYAGDPDCGPFGDDTVHQDIWYEYQAACSGQLTVTTCSDLGGSAGFDTRLAIQDGCASVQDPALACNDDDPQHPCGSAPSFQSTLTVAVTAGECYAVRVGGFQTGNAGSGTLNVTENLVNCGCPNTAVTFMDPPSGVVDARQPHQPANPGAALGIDRMVVQASADVADTVCWSLCESSTLGPPNSITAVTDNGNGTFTVQLARPITANAVTKLRYTASGAVGTFTSHPANINGDSTSGPQDLLALIDSLNGAANLPWGLYSGDVDHSGVVNGQDIIAVIDLLNGAGAFEPWNGSALPDGGACP